MKNAINYTHGLLCWWILCLWVSSLPQTTQMNSVRGFVGFCRKVLPTQMNRDGSGRIGMVLDEQGDLVMSFENRVSGLRLVARDGVRKFVPRPTTCYGDLCSLHLLCYRCWRPKAVAGAVEHQQTTDQLTNGAYSVGRCWYVKRFKEACSSNSMGAKNLELSLHFMGASTIFVDLPVGTGSPTQEHRQLLTLPTCTHMPKPMNL